MLQTFPNDIGRLWWINQQADEQQSRRNPNTFGEDYRGRYTTCQNNEVSSIEASQKYENEFSYFVRIFELASDISSSTIFSTLVPGAILVASGLYSTELVTKKVAYMKSLVNNRSFCWFHWQGLKNEIADASFGMACIADGFIWPFVLCRMATSATFHVAKIGEVAFNTNWYKYPPNLRKYLVLIMVRSRNPTYFTGLKLFPCTLEVFMRVIFPFLRFLFGLTLEIIILNIILQLNKSAASYYLMFRNLSGRWMN